MKYGKFVFGLLIVLLALGSFGFALAQDKLPAVKLVMWSTEEESQRKIMSDLFTKWADENAPGSTLEIVNKETETERNDLQTAGLAGSGLPDMVVGPNDPIGVYVDAGIILPLDEKFDTKLFLASALEPAQLGGKTYGIPFTAGNHLMLMYNKKFVEKAPDTWEELIATAKSVQEKNSGVQGFEYNLVEPFWFLPFVHGFGGSVFDAEGKFTMDTQAWIDAYQFVSDLKYKDKVVPNECDYNCADGQFKEGTVAMILNGDWVINDYLDTTKAPALGKDNLGIAPWPKLANGERPKPFTSGRYISIPVTVEGDNLNAVVAFVKWLSTDETAIKALTTDIGRLPAVSSVTVDAKENPIAAESATVLATGTGMPADPKLRCMWDAVRPNLEGVMAGNLKPDEAAKEGQISAEDCAAK